MACIVYHGFKNLETIFCEFCCIISIFLGIWAIYYKRNVFSVQNIRLPIQASENLPESPFFKISLAMASRLVLMLVPGSILHY